MELGAVRRDSRAFAARGSSCASAPSFASALTAGPALGARDICLLSIPALAGSIHTRWTSCLSIRSRRCEWRERKHSPPSAALTGKPRGRHIRRVPRVRPRSAGSVAFSVPGVDTVATENRHPFVNLATPVGENGWLSRRPLRIDFDAGMRAPERRNRRLGDRGPCKVNAPQAGNGSNMREAPIGDGGL